MAIFEVWDIVKVPFPYTDRPVRQRRPALVVAAGEIEAAHGLLWLVMITSAENRGSPGDIGISDLGTAGLPAPSIVRPAKIHGGCTRCATARHAAWRRSKSRCNRFARHPRILGAMLESSERK
jgi:mRNA interferase MazF